MPNSVLGTYHSIYFSHELYNLITNILSTHYVAATVVRFYMQSIHWILGRNLSDRSCNRGNGSSERPVQGHITRSDRPKPLPYFAYYCLTYLINEKMVFLMDKKSLSATKFNSESLNVTSWTLQHQSQ